MSQGLKEDAMPRRSSTTSAITLLVVGSSLTLGVLAHQLSADGRGARQNHFDATTNNYVEVMGDQPDVWEVDTLWQGYFEEVVANQPGARKVDILDETDGGLNGDEPDIGFVQYNQLGNGDLRITVHVAEPPSGVGPLPCDLNVELVVPAEADPFSPVCWPSGAIDELGHWGTVNPLGTLTLNANGVGTRTFIVDATSISNAQPSGERNYAHVDLEGCGLVTNQVGAGRIEWISP
jgi:hypothetical protein